MGEVMKYKQSVIFARAANTVIGFAVTAITTLTFTVSSAAAANQTSFGNAAQGRAWAEALADVSSWNGEWYLPYGADLLRPAQYIVENGAIYVIDRNGGGLKKRVENIMLVRTYREGAGLVHEYSVTCVPQIGNSFTGKLLTKTDFRGPNNDGSYFAFPTISSSSCGITAIRREGPKFSSRPYP